MTIDVDVEPLVLDPWQVDVKNQIVSRGRFGVGAEMGMGKTPPVLAGMEELQPVSCLIIVRKVSMIGWHRMMGDWFPDMFSKYTTIITRNSTERKAQWDKDPNFIFTTYDWFLRDQKWIHRRNYQMIILDEAHKRIRGRKTKTFAALKQFHPVYFIPVTGSPAGRDASQFWTYLHLINPRLFPSYWKFVNTFCLVIDGPWGKEVYGAKNIDSFRTVLRQHFYLLEKKDIGHHKKRKLFLDCEMTEPQAKAYNDMVKDKYFITSEGKVEAAPNMMTKIVRLRQLLAYPGMLDPQLGFGGAIESVKDALLDMSQEDRHCVIFTPFRAAVEGIHKALNTQEMDKNFFLFMGGMEMHELEDTLAQWRQWKGIAICTIAFAESFDMETCDKAFFIGYDWDPFVNRQAEDRVDRRNNLHTFLRMFYVRTLGTFDENVMENLVHKSINLNAIYNDPIKLKRLLELDPNSVSDSVPNPNRNRAGETPTSEQEEAPT